MSDDAELESERQYLATVRAAHREHLDRAQESARLLGVEAADAAAEGIRDIVDEDAEADTAVRAAQVRQTAIRAMHAANRVRELEGKGTALAFGRFSTDSDEHSYIGRLSVFEGDETLLIDWRAPAAVPFYRATPLDRHEVRSRRQFHYASDSEGADGTLAGYSDDVLDLDALTEATALRGEAAVLAAVNAPTKGEMKPVVAMIQSEQDAIIRADAETPLIVQGGPGTGKTVVALHRAAYLLYDQRDELSDRGVLIVGPTRRFLRYVSNVLPSLGETGVVSATPAELFPAMRGHEESQPLTNLKGQREMVSFLRAAVKDRQRRPTAGLKLFYGSRRVVLADRLCQAIFDRAQRTATHNDGAEQFRLGLIDALVDAVYDPAFFSVEEATASFVRHDDVKRYLLTHWPTLTPEQCLNDVLGSKGLLRSAGQAAGLRAEQVQLLYRPRSSEVDLMRRRWADGDMPLLDELEALLGQRATELTASARRRERDVEDEFELAEALDEAESVMGDDGTVRRGQRVTGTLDLDVATSPSIVDIESVEANQEETPDPGTLVDRFQGDRAAMVGDVDPTELTPDVVDDLAIDGVTVVELAAGERSFRFGHVIVDEAQDLSSMQWRMIVRRAQPGCITAVGDLAQRTIASASKWADILPAMGPVNEMHLTINYRSPGEVLAPASVVLGRYAPDLQMPEAIRFSGVESELIAVKDLGAELTAAVERLLAERTSTGDDQRVAAIIFPEVHEDVVAAAVAQLAPMASVNGYDLQAVRSTDCRGLEFDASIVVGPEEFGDAGPELALLFVALTRSTQWSAVVAPPPIAPWLQDAFATPE